MVRTLISLIIGIYIWCHVQVAYASYPLAYVGQTEIHDISLSTKGDQIVLLKQGKREREWSKIEIKDAKTGKIERIIQKEYRSIFWVNWIEDDLILAYAREYVEGKKRYYVSDKLLGISPTDGSIRTIYETESVKAGKTLNGFRLVKVSPDRKAVALRVLGKRSTELIHASYVSDEVKKVADGSSKTLYWLLDDDLVPFIRIDAGGEDYIRKYFKKSEKGKWTLFRTVNLLESTFEEIAIGKDGDTYLLMGRPKSADRVGLYKSIIGGEKKPELIYEHGNYDLSSVTLETFNDEILYAGWWDDTYQKHWFNPIAKSSADRLRTHLEPYDNWRLVETSRDLSVWLIYVSSYENPGSYQIWSADAGIIYDLESLRPGLTPDTLSRRISVQYLSEDGIELDGYFTPAIDKGQTAPLIVMPHGGPVMRDKGDWDGWSQFFAFSGYSVFQPNFRGSGGYGRKFEKMGHGQWGRLMQTDIEDGVNHLIQTGRVNANSKRAIVGASYGGYAALMAAIQTPENYACVISVNGVSHIPKFIDQFDQSDPAKSETREIWIERIGDPESQNSNFQEISPAFHADKISSRVRLIHGTDDQIVRIEQSEVMYETAKAKGVDISFKRLRDVGHNNWSPKVATDVLADMEWFLLDCMD